jgi:Leucine-rich repeat (LRR) protein
MEFTMFHPYYCNLWRPAFLAALTGVVLSLSACDHAKDLVEQGKKQAEDLQKTMEGKKNETVANSPPAAGSAGTAASSSPNLPSSSSAASGNATAPSTPAANPPKDYGLLLETFMKLDPGQRSDYHLQELGASPEEIRGRLTECNVTYSRVTNAGLAELSKFPNLISLNLTGCLGIDDNGLAGIKDVTGLEVLRLEGTKISDAGMVHLRNLTRLKVLGLSQGVTDDGLAKLRDLSQLEEFYLSGTFISGSGLRNVNLGTSLRIVHAPRTAFGTAGIARLSAHKNLEEVDLTDAQVSDKTVGSLKGLGKLRSLTLNHNMISDVGVRQLTGLHGLEELMLGGTQITDDCLPVFKPCKKLRHVYVKTTAVSSAGVAFIKKFAPKCLVES